MEKFIPNEMYQLSDEEGFKAYSVANLPLALDIKTYGGVIVPKQVDPFGNVRGVEFGDGKIDTSAIISGGCRKFFKLLDPLPVSVAKPVPKVLKVEMVEALAA